MKTQILSTIFITLILVSTQAFSQSDSKVTKPDTTLANQYFAKAEELIQKARYDSSNYYFKKASVIYETVGNEYNERIGWEKHVACINNIGNNFRRLGKYEQAMEYLHRALEIGFNKVGQNHIEIANIYYNIGIVEFYKSNYEAALKYSNEALASRIRSLGTNHPKIADSYNILGLIYEKKGDFDKALEYYNKSITIKIELLGENDLGVANTYQNIGVATHHKGDYFKSLEYFNKSLAIRSKLLESNHPQIADSYTLIALIHSEKGDLTKSLEYQNKALAIYLNKWGEDHPNVAYSYNNIGQIHFDQGEYDEALKYLSKSVELKIKLFGAKHRSVASTYRNIGQVYFKKNDYDKAIEYYDKCLATQLPLLGNKHIAVANTYQNIGEVYYQKNDFEKSLSFLQKAIIAALPDFNDANIYVNPPLMNMLLENDLVETLVFKADAFKKLYSSISNDIKNIEMCLVTYQLTSELIDRIVSSYKAEASKLFWGEKVLNIYDKAIQTALKLNEITQKNEYKEQAFLFAEKAKSSVLLASLRDSKAKKFAGIPDSVLEQERELRIDLAFYDTQIQKELEKNEDRDSLKLREFEAKYFTLNTKYEKLITRIEADYPKYYDLKYQTQAASILELQHSLDAQSALIEYFVGDSSIFIITVSNDNFNIHTIPKDTAFNVLTESLNESIKQVESQAYLPMCHQLYNLLIKPVAPKIATKEKLVIIPHGILYKIPFEALIPELPASTDRLDLAQVDYLISRYDISYHYSATLYLNSLQQMREYATENQLADEEFIGFAPVFSDEVKNGYILADNSPTIEVIRTASDLRSITLDGKWFNELLYSKQEVEKILDLFKRRGAVGYFNTDASEENFKQNAKHYKYIHVATHGMINETNPPLSGIIFSQPTDSVYTEDGILYSGETYHLDLNADLVVLSSCESGIGKLVAGEGLMALTRGFLYAGASTLVVSLWKVSDVSTAQLMTEFYRHLKQGMSKAAALRAAKLSLLKHSLEMEGIKFSFAHPFFWALFVLIGEPESHVTIGTMPSYLSLGLALLAIVVIILAGILWKRKKAGIRNVE